MKLSGRKRLWALALAAGLAFGLGSLAAASAAGLFEAPGAGNSNEPLEIVANRLVTNDAEKFAEFSGAVKATQGRFNLTADTLRIYYEGELMNAPKGGKSTQDAIKRIVADGKVHIVSDEYTADTSRAEYVLETDELTLSGPGSRVISGKNSLTGSKIILNRGQGKARVESSGSERVRAVFYQEEKPEKPEDGDKDRKK
jgi:lipopolysaccharide transport protein LptA